MTFPVIEVFGPTLQGEGALAGVPTHFVRFGLCDYRCEWCDSMYAVEPDQVKANAERLPAVAILDRLLGLDGHPEWVTLSGGNPAIHDLGGLVQMLHAADFSVCVETQGSRWRDWLADVDCLTVSPKPPSSGMATEAHARQLGAFMENANAHVKADGGALKIVVFDDVDYEWAAAMFERYPAWPAFVSAGTDPIGKWGSEVASAISHRQTLAGIAERYAWIAEKVARDPAMQNVRAFPQLHVIAFGHARGV